jgi:signal transduction histidine kinase
VEPDFIVVLVSDSIENLPADIADKVMLPDFTTKKGGSGLGLLFVRKIITLHKGDIGVGITPVGGLEFTIRLPAGELYA